MLRQRAPLDQPNTKGEQISISDPRYKDQVVLVQILGSWCPNCMDESKFYVEWLKQHPDAPVEIIGLAFEKKTDPAFAYPKIDRMKERFGIPYEVLLAGLNSGAEAAKALKAQVPHFKPLAQQLLRREVEPTRGSASSSP